MLTGPARKAGLPMLTQIITDIPREQHCDVEALWSIFKDIGTYHSLLTDASVKTQLNRGTYI